MKPENEAGRGAEAGVEPALAALLARLETLAEAPGFAVQRQVALSRALRLYLDSARPIPLGPTEEEVAQAQLYLYADYFPEDGQLSLIEQLRDLIEVHVPAEERAWLDPLRHSYLDLLDVVETGNGGGTFLLRSLGDGRTDRAAAGAAAGRARPGQVLLGRPVRGSTRTILVGGAVVLSAARARTIKRGADEWRRELESDLGDFALGEWQEFAKRYGYILLWQLAQARVEALRRAIGRIRYRTERGEPFLYARALYEHDDPGGLAAGMARWEGWKLESSAGGDPTTATWVLTEGAAPVVAGRVTLTPTQVWVECDGRERLDAVKHQLAGAFGYRLHFRGETVEPPAPPPIPLDLSTDEEPPLLATVSAEESRRLAAAFLEACYLDWADRPSPALKGQTPRHAALDPKTRPRAAELLVRMERDDPSPRWCGAPAYDYGRLRAHLGL